MVSDGPPAPIGASKVMGKIVKTKAEEEPRGARETQNRPREKLETQKNPAFYQSPKSDRQSEYNLSTRSQILCLLTCNLVNYSLGRAQLEIKQQQR